MINSHRLLVRGEKIDYVPAVQEANINVNRQSNMYQMLFYITLGILALVLFLVAIVKIVDIRKKKKKDSI